MTPGTRFLQCPLGTPRERQSRPASMVVTTSELDLRLRQRNWPSEWDRQAADWLPAKIYTHQQHKKIVTNDPNPILIRPDRSAYPHMQSMTKMAERTPRYVSKPKSRPLRSGTMVPCFAFWSEYYKRVNRRH